MQVMEEDEPVIPTFSELISSDPKGLIGSRTAYLHAQVLHLSGNKIRELLTYHHGVDQSYVRIHAGTREVTNLERPLSEAGTPADATIEATIAGISGRTRRVQQSIAAYFREHEDEETRQLCPYSSSTLEVLSWNSTSLNPKH